MSKLRLREGRRLAQVIYGVGEELGSHDSLTSALFKRMRSGQKRRREEK